MPFPLFHVNAFTSKPFAGNPAAVCLLTFWPEDRWLQAVAAEMNLSETAFLVPQNDHYHLRWFTPLVEVDLCGHATLASAHTLWQEGIVTGDQIRFASRSGILGATRKVDWIELDFPTKPETQCQPPPGLLEGLGVQARYVGKNQFDYLVEVESEAIVRTLTPDFRKLAALPVRGIMVTSRSDHSEYDIVSRFFAPAVGVDEDPVTGSAHCCLGGYWRKQLGKDSLVAFQASQRGGLLKLRVNDQRTILGGQAVRVAQGQWLVEP